MIPATTSRVPMCTNPQLNERLHDKIHQRVGQSALTAQGIDQRLHELDREWDIDRAVEVTIAVASIAGIALGVTVDQWWLALSALAAGTLLSHALFGWSLSLPLFRRMGVRTATEIAYERYALKALRGDFHQISPAKPTEEKEALATFENEGGMCYGPPVPGASDPHVVKAVLEAVQK